VDSLGLTAVLAAIFGAPVGAIVQWLATRNKTAGEAQAAIAGGAKDVVEASSMVLDQMQESIDTMKKEFEKKISYMQKEIDELRSRLEDQKIENKKLRDELSIARKTINQLETKVSDDK
jgi:predicted RNase H-like nuclease (RuvC/YqgF family)